MKALRSETSIKSGVSHRAYRDEHGTDTVFCRLISNQNELLRLARGITRVELRQAPGTGWVPAAMTDPLVEAIRSIDLVAGSDDPRAVKMEREMRRRITDALARIRIRCNRDLLAGLTHTAGEGEEETVLVLIFARRGIRSCDWKLAA